MSLPRYLLSCLMRILIFQFFKKSSSRNRELEQKLVQNKHVLNWGRYARQVRQSVLFDSFHLPARRQGFHDGAQLSFASKARRTDAGEACQSSGALLALRAMLSRDDGYLRPRTRRGSGAKTESAEGCGFLAELSWKISGSRGRPFLCIFPPARSETPAALPCPCECHRAEDGWWNVRHGPRSRELRLP